MPDTPEGLTVGESGLSDAQTNFINENFRGTLSEEQRTHPLVVDFKNVGDLTKSMLNSQKMVGADKIIIPKSKEDWTDVNHKLGMPTEAKGYELKTPDGSTDADREWWETFAHTELQLSKMQANKAWDEMNTRSASAREDYSTKNIAKLADADKSLREEWGVNYDAMVTATNKGLQRMDEDGRFREWMKETGLNQQPEMLRFANKVAQLFSEDRAPGDTHSPGPMSVDKATAELRKMHSDAQKDPKNPFYNKKDPAHADYVKKAEQLAVVAGGNR